MVLLSCIGKLIGDDGYFEDETITPCFQPGFLLDLGIYWVQNLRQFLIAGVAVGNSDKIMSNKCDQVCRASELPVYIYNERTNQNQAMCPAKPSMLENAVRSVRQGMWSMLDTLKIYRSDTEDVLRKQSTRASSMVRYLSEESNETTRMGAVGVGVLAGFLMGMRGGMIRRLIYAGTGGYAMSAVCYPKQTLAYSEEGLQQTKRLVKITYNFIYGVNGNNKTNDEMFKLPQLPSSLDEMWHRVSDFSKSTTAMITGKEDKKETVTKSEE